MIFLIAILIEVTITKKNNLFKIFLFLCYLNLNYYFYRKSKKKKKICESCAMFVEFRFKQFNNLIFCTR